MRIYDFLGFDVISLSVADLCIHQLFESRLYLVHVAIRISCDLSVSRTLHPIRHNRLWNGLPVVGCQLLLK